LFNWRWSLSDPYTFWAGLIGGAVLTIGTHGTDHMMVQRYLSARSQRDAGRALIASGFVVCAQFALFLLIGVGLAAFYAHQPAKVFSKDDVVFADFIISSFPRNTGLIGLMLAAILAAAMSTLSSSLNSSASAFVNDFYVGWCRETPSPDRLFHVTRRLTIVFGLVQVVIGVVAFGFENSVVRNALTIAGFSSGLLLGVFALGVITTHVDQFSALVAMAIGLTVLLAIQFATPLVNVRVAFPWIPLIGCTTTFLAGLAVARLKSIGRPGS
ncbi:MAG: transporter, partial [Pirellulaceae bacterium]